jgi:hypothetical protein
MRNIRCLLKSIPFVLLAVALPGHAAGWGAVEFNTGNRTEVLRFDWLMPSRFAWEPSESSRIYLNWVSTAAYWRENRAGNVSDRSSSLIDLGLVPSFRWIGVDNTGWWGDVGIGLHGFTKRYDNNGHILSTNLQFASHLGLGYRFGDDFELGAKIEHFSNGGIKQPNDGINFFGVQFGHRF